MATSSLPESPPPPLPKLRLKFKRSKDITISVSETCTYRHSVAAMSEKKDTMNEASFYNLLGTLIAPSHDSAIHFMVFANVFHREVAAVTRHF